VDLGHARSFPSVPSANATPVRQQAAPATRVAGALDQPN